MGLSPDISNYVLGAISPYLIIGGPPKITMEAKWVGLPPG